MLKRSKKRPKVSCDCGKIFEKKVIVARLDEGVERVYFICPKCKAEYTKYCTDSNIRAKINRLQFLEVNHGMAYDKGDEIQAEKVFRLIQKMKSEIDFDIQVLVGKVASN